MIVLVVEDYEPIQTLIKDVLEESGVELIQATTLKEARNAFEERGDELDLVAMDACLGTNSPNTLELVREIRMRRGLSFPIMAMSGSPDQQKDLEFAGCNYIAPYKPQAPFFLLAIVMAAH